MQVAFESLSRRSRSLGGLLSSESLLCWPKSWQASTAEPETICAGTSSSLRFYDTKAEASLPGLPVSGSRPRVVEAASPSSVLLGVGDERLLKQLEGEAQEGRAGAAVSRIIQQISQTDDSEASPTPADEFDRVLEDLGGLLEAGDYEASTALLSRELGINARPILGQLKELQAQMQQESRRRERRKLEEKLQETLQQQRLRAVDSAGRAYGTGKRKTSVARVWVRAAPGSRAGLGSVLVNGQPVDAYFRQILARMQVFAPFEVTSTLGSFDVNATVAGGGFSGQAQAVRHGIAKALQCWDPELRPPLKQYGYLTRDARIVERKKPGKAKARKSFQWVKR